MNRFAAQIHKIDKVIFAWPWLTMLVILAVTVFFALQIPAVRIVSDFADLLPQQHPYIQLHNSIRDTFGGANNVILSVEVEEGDVLGPRHQVLRADPGDLRTKLQGGVVLEPEEVLPPSPETVVQRQVEAYNARANTYLDSVTGYDDDANPADAVADIFGAFGWPAPIIHKDMDGRDRCLEYRRK